MATSLNFPKLPPLKALSGFESTARMRSFRKAAEELNLTHPAISHQIRSLEKNLGVKLFVREGRQAVLTPEGERFYPVAREALEILINGSEAIRRSQRRCRNDILPHATRWTPALDAANAAKTVSSLQS